jgi:hypothetical protein
LRLSFSLSYRKKDNRKLPLCQDVVSVLTERTGCSISERESFERALLEGSGGEPGSRSEVKVVWSFALFVSLLTFTLPEGCMLVTSVVHLAANRLEERK